MAKQKQTYIPILYQAFKTTWRHKHLWLFGIFAGIMNTGVVVNVVLKGLKQTSHLGNEALFQAVVPYATPIVQFFQELGHVSIDRLAITFIAGVCLMALLLFLGLQGQASLFEDIQKTFGKKQTRKHREPKFFQHKFPLLSRILLVDILAKISMLALFLITGFLFRELISPDLATNLITNTALLLVFIPTSLLIGYLTMFALIEVVLKNKSTREAIYDGWELLKDHWLVVSELAILLFFINFLGSMLLILAFILFAIPYTLLFIGALMIPSSLIPLLMLTIGGIGTITILLTFLGFFTSVTYASWFGLYKKIGGNARMVSMFERFIGAWNS